MVFAEFFINFQKTSIFSAKFWNKFAENYQSPYCNGGSLLESNVVGPRDVLVEKNKVTFEEKPSSSPQGPRLMAIAYSFWLKLLAP